MPFDPSRAFCRIARDYLSQGLRERARDLVTLELGPETKHELDQKIEREVQSERFTRIDRSLLNDADQGIMTVLSSPHQNQQWQSHRMGRLRKLESMGLVGPGPHKTGDIAKMVGKQSSQLGPTRDALITNGMIYSPKYGYAAFTVPLFDEFLKRTQS